VEQAAVRHAEYSEIARSRGGRLLSPEYLGNKKRLLWRCRFGHEWMATPQDIKFQGSWCHACDKGFGERTCRLFFEQAFKVPFPTKRPKWLISPAGGRMELDGYNENLALGFEHQGMYHYKEIEIHHRKHDLHTRQSYDARKRELCSEHGVLLIEVPEIGTLTPVDKLKPLVIDALQAAEWDVPPSLDEIVFDSGLAYTTMNYDFCVKLAEKQGGKLLSPGFVEWHAPMRWQCAKGHEWEASPGQLKHSKTWCPVCSNRARHSVDQLQEVAERRGGKCLSKKYHGTHHKYTWQCKEGHQWTAIYTSIEQGSWCPHCAGQATSPALIDRYRKIAKERGGECLSNTYVNARKKLQFRCKVGHEWWAFPDNVRRGSWCNLCANKLRTGRPKRT